MPVISPLSFPNIHQIFQHTIFLPLLKLTYGSAVIKTGIFSQKEHRNSRVMLHHAFHTWTPFPPSAAHNTYIWTLAGKHAAVFGGSVPEPGPAAPLISAPTSCPCNRTLSFLGSNITLTLCLNGMIFLFKSTEPAYKSCSDQCLAFSGQQHEPLQIFSPPVCIGRRSATASSLPLPRLSLS